MKAIRLGSKIITTLVRDSVYYPTRLVAETLGILLRCVVLFSLYWYVFKINGGIVNGVTFPVVAWSMFLYFAFLVFRLRNIAREIMQDIQSGNIEVLLSKPVSYLSYRMWWQLGAGTYSFIVVLLAGGIGLALTVGFPAIASTDIFIPTFAAAFVFASMLALFLYSCVGLLAFWIEDINPIFWVVDKMVMILGGSYLPVALFPDFMYKLAVWSPFGASQFITHTVYDSWQMEWMMKIGIQFGWIIVMGALMFFLFKKAREKVSVNGG